MFELCLVSYIQFVYLLCRYTFLTPPEVSCHEPNVCFCTADREKSESAGRGKVSFEPTETNLCPRGSSVKRLSDESGHEAH